MNADISVTIVGASLAGLRGAEALRRDGYAGIINLVGEEVHHPYDRPPLSKQYLAGAWDRDRLSLTPDDKFSALDLNLFLGRRATALDVENRVVTLDDGTPIQSDGILISTGARPRLLPANMLPAAKVPGQAFPGLHLLRSLDDATRLAEDFVSGPSRVAVIGAGFIGAEVAATAREAGLEVSLIEAAPAPMIRGLGETLGHVCADIHRAHGVDVHLGVGVKAIQGDAAIERVLLADGTEIECDVVVVGIGVTPNIEWLEGSGLTLDDGVLCDETCLAAEGIVAAGDVARWPNVRFGEVMRVEHWDNAVDQGTYAARRLLAGISEKETPEPFAPVPFFWSDQFDRKLQMAGRRGVNDEMRIVDGSIEENRFAAIFGDGERITAVFGMNRPRQVMTYRRLIGDDARWTDAIAVAESAV